MPTFPSLPSFLLKYRHFLQIEFLSVVVCVVFIVRWKKTHHDWSVIRLFLLSTTFFRCCKSVRGDNDFRRRYLFESTCFSCFSRKIVLWHWKVRVFIRFVLIVSIFWPDKRFSRYPISFWRRLADKRCRYDAKNASADGFADEYKPLST